MQEEGRLETRNKNGQDIRVSCKQNKQEAAGFFPCLCMVGWCLAKPEPSPPSRLLVTL